MPSESGFALRLSPRGQRMATGVLWLAAIIGLLIGLGALRLHLTTDPLADVHAYYNAGARLNAGLPLYDQPANTDDAAFYRYPPLLAIAFRLLALLPFDVAAFVWEALLIAFAALTVARLGFGHRTFLALGMLAMPILWTLAVGQAQALVTLLLALGTPLSVALAGHLKLTPWLAAVFWLGRRDWRALSRLLAWILGFGLLQFALAPQATLDYLRFPSLSQVGDVVNLSPFAVHPILWAGLAVAGVAVALLAAPTRWGWAAAVALAVLVTPRLLAYQLSSLLAVLGGPRESAAGTETPEAAA